ncbi:MAG TPA: hypothetical protein PKC43_04875 [Phycisphaerales bacterium]|nr:hypothetical protein [Phycisphaerales bacterium]HMP36762.1 hypothetical protein [Phycisphaerales bacterium]
MAITPARLGACGVILGAALAAAILLRGSLATAVAIAVAALVAAGAVIARPAAPEQLVEPTEVDRLDPERLRELVRGTSLRLRDMHYRYSVRPDRGSRAAFTEAVNSIVLGFVPVIITDNQTDREGRGYVAFVHDGRRWRGPGLPCAGSREEALQHAARCVQPLGAAGDDAEGEAPEPDGEEGDRPDRPEAPPDGGRRA